MNAQQRRKARRAHNLGRPACPKDSYTSGYGFAYGGGLGSYEACDTCGWVRKHIDVEETKKLNADHSATVEELRSRFAGSAGNAAWNR